MKSDRVFFRRDPCPNCGNVTRIVTKKPYVKITRQMMEIAVFFALLLLLMFLGLAKTH